jgi:hypothetical protein
MMHWVGYVAILFDGGSKVKKLLCNVVHLGNS